MLNRIKAAYSALVKPVPTGGFEMVLDEKTQRFVPVETLGDGKAEFLGEGTTDEYLDQLREDEGSKSWYDRLKRLGKTEDDTRGGNTAG